MSNIELTNLKYDVSRKIYKILGMGMENYVGTYDFYVRQIINYKTNGKDSKAFITVFSNAAGNYIDCKKGNQDDLKKFDFGKRCVYKKGNTIITGAGSNPKMVLLQLKSKALIKIINRVIVFLLILYTIYLVYKIIL